MQAQAELYLMLKARDTAGAVQGQIENYYRLYAEIPPGVSVLEAHLQRVRDHALIEIERLTLEVSLLLKAVPKPQVEDAVVVDLDTKIVGGDPEDQKAFFAEFDRLEAGQQ